MAVAVPTQQAGEGNFSGHHSGAPTYVGVQNSSDGKVLVEKMEPGTAAMDAPPAQPQKVRKTASKYRGVSWNLGYRKWRARITINNKVIHLGNFHSEEEAARAYAAAAVLRDQEKMNEGVEFSIPGRRTRPRAKDSSQFRGVSWNKSMKKWTARITVRGQQMYLGHFDDEVAAARRYDEAAISHLGKNAKVNFEKESHAAFDRMMRYDGANSSGVPPGMNAGMDPRSIMLNRAPTGHYSRQQQTFPHMAMAANDLPLAALMAGGRMAGHAALDNGHTTINPQLSHFAAVLTFLKSTVGLTHEQQVYLQNIIAGKHMDNPSASMQMPQLSAAQKQHLAAAEQHHFLFPMQQALAMRPMTNSATNTNMGGQHQHMHQHVHQDQPQAQSTITQIPRDMQVMNQRLPMVAMQHSGIQAVPAYSSMQLMAPPTAAVFVGHQPRMQAAMPQQGLPETSLPRMSQSGVTNQDTSEAQQHPDNMHHADMPHQGLPPQMPHQGLPDMRQHSDVAQLGSPRLYSQPQPRPKLKEESNKRPREEEDSRIMQMIRGSPAMPPLASDCTPSEVAVTQSMVTMARSALPPRKRCKAMNEAKDTATSGEAMNVPAETLKMVEPRQSLSAEYIMNAATTEEGTEV